jgi:hypothetical protein
MEIPKSENEKLWRRLLSTENLKELPTGIYVRLVLF